MRAIVFGSTGFFGSHVVEQLHRAGHSVCAVVRASSDRRFLDSLGVEVRTLDFSDASLVDAMDGVEVAYNCTADTRLHLDEDRRRAVEIELTRRIVRAAVEARVLRYVQLSTIQVYGPLPDEPVDEEHECAPVHDYQRASVAREEVVRQEADRGGIAWTIVRPVTTTGARDTSLMPNLYPVHQRGVFPVFGKGLKPLSMVDARDVGRAMVLLGKSPESAGGVFLVSGFDTTWSELKRALDRATGTTARTIRLPPGPMKLLARAITALTPKGREPPLHPLAVDTMARTSLFDDRRLRSLGYRPRHELDGAVGAAVASIREDTPW